VLYIAGSIVLVALGIAIFTSNDSTPTIHGTHSATSGSTRPDVTTTAPARGIPGSTGGTPASTGGSTTGGPTTVPGASTTTTPTVAVPGLSQQTLAQACQELTKSQLRCGSQSTASSGSVPKGEVISSMPAAGTVVTRGSVVNLVVSEGPLVVPDVLGLDYPAAAGVIAGVGLEPRIGTTCTGQSPRVVSQVPSPGSAVPQGAAVFFTCGN